MMRKPGIILLRGEPEACTAARDALNAAGIKCETWWIPDASAALITAVTRDHGAEVWTCATSTFRGCCIAVRGTELVASCSAATWSEVVRLVLGGVLPC